MKNSILSGWFAAILWGFSALQVGTVVVRLFSGKVGETPLIGNQLQPGAGSERYVAIALLVAFAALLVELARLFVRLNIENLAANVFGTSGVSNRMAIVAGTMARRRADLLTESRSLDADTLGQILGGASSVDSASLENMFSFARALTWALPSLGFIGAAFGLSQSIGGFSVALKAGDTSKLVASLAQEVIPGLAGSFSITIVALAAATAGHLCVTSLLARGHSVISQLDSSNLATVARSAATDSPDGGGSNWSTLHETLNQLVAEIQELNRNLGQRDEQEAVADATRQMEDAAGQLKVAAQLFVDSINQPYVVTIERQRRDPVTG